MGKNRKITVQDIDISIIVGEQDYICITDMAKSKEGDNRAADIIKNWIRSRSTLDFLAAWETIYNPNFKVVEFDHLRNKSGVPSFDSGKKKEEENLSDFNKKLKKALDFNHKDK